MPIDIRKGDSVRIVKIMSDMSLREEIVIGYTYDVVESSSLDGPILIKYRPDGEGYENAWWIPRASCELVESSPHSRIIRKIADIKARRERLGYQY